jgi:hypothetical protein
MKKLFALLFAIALVSTSAVFACNGEKDGKDGKGSSTSTKDTKQKT